MKIISLLSTLPPRNIMFAINILSFAAISFCELFCNWYHDIDGIGSPEALQLKLIKPVSPLSLVNKAGYNSRYAKGGK